MQQEILIKQLIYRSNHRGCKETDILLGKFFNSEFQNFSLEKLQLYSQFIEEDDMLIYDWILQKQKPDEKYLSLILEIQKFHQIV
jgi:succinate dehydrogenase flavin-adding protein (antitoxin of CptAB toxin-antitoxin module)